MFFYKGLSCPHCSELFHDTDDIVACPVCGAPHHRQCWLDNGDCACADDHGTDRQWTREGAQNSTEAPTEPDNQHTVLCPRCAAVCSETATYCTVCGTPLSSPDTPPQTPFGTPPAAFHEYTPFHTNHVFHGGIAPDTVIEDETAEDLGAVVHTNTAYYLPRFHRMATNRSRASWNWAAFFIPSYWLLYRRQYISGAFVLALEILEVVISQLFMIRCFSSVFEQKTYLAQAEELQRLLLTDKYALLGMGIIFFMSFAFFCVRVFIAVFGNRLYMKHCLRVIKKTRNNYPEGYRAQLYIVGGTSFALAVTGYLCYQLLPGLLLML